MVFDHTSRNLGVSLVTKREKVLFQNKFAGKEPLVGPGTPFFDISPRLRAAATEVERTSV